ncbi:MAG: FlgD immunoglobulin-like domain containing protein, partial [bacterium]|nr:FlgD immunoglobulin-like domain containing protein [bacterium]
NPKTCTITFGKWNGDYLPITIEPKKVGTETIRFTNTANKEEWQLTINVTALPVKASFEDPVISSGANYLIVDSNTVSFTFKTNRKAKDVEFRVYDDNGKVVRKINIGALAAKKETTVKWNGLNSSGKPVNSVCTYAVLADGTKTIGGSIKVLPTSPFGQGEGTENNPFMVSNVDEFLMMKDYSGDCFVQDADIDFKYMPVSSLFDELIPFSGSFSGKNNGKSYQMMNLMGYQSLFGTIAKTGVVRDLTMTNCVINSFGSFLAYTNYGTIENCSVTGNILCNSGQQAAMIAIVNKGQIHDCKVSGKMSVNATDVTDSTTLKAGGIVVQNEGIIAQCVSSVKMSQMLEVGQLVSSNKYKVQCGGIAVENAAEAFIVTCTFDGKIETKVKMEDLLSPNYEILSGGIAAENKIGSYITQCTFSGAIETKEIAWDVPVNTLLTSENLYIGYVAGRNDSYISTCVNASSNKELAVFGTGTGMVQ